MKVYARTIVITVCLVLFGLLVGCPSPAGLSSVPAPSTDKQSATIGTLKQISGGSFYNGVANVTVSTFYMMQYDVTRTMYQAVMGTDPVIGNSMGKSDPVTRVSWYDTLVFCNKLSLQEGLKPVYTINGSTNPATWGASSTSTFSPSWDVALTDLTANGYRLPTEMEYMWAAMGGLKDSRSSDISGQINTGGYTKGYSGSQEATSTQANFSDYAWYYQNSGNTTHPVGLKPANELGLYDMTGNVNQWTGDWYGSYGLSNQIDPLGAATGTVRVIKGGSFASITGSSTIAYRGQGNPFMNIYINIGFRVVRR